MPAKCTSQCLACSKGSKMAASTPLNLKSLLLGMFNTLWDIAFSAIIFESSFAI